MVYKIKKWQKMFVYLFNSIFANRPRYLRIKMNHEIKHDGKFTYYEAGEGTPIVILHGLMGGLSNFESVADYLVTQGHKVLMPELPLYTQSLLKTNVKAFSRFVKDFIVYKGLDRVVLLGNSLGGHIALYITKMYPEKVAGLVLTGSSGLYESAMGDSYPKRGDYQYIKNKTESVFYDPNTATKEMVDEIFALVNDRIKVIKTVTIAKSAIRHNMAKDLPKMHVKTCLIWGKNDAVTPPEVAEEFHKLMPNSNLFWIDKCGHAAMMEHPAEFNKIVGEWLEKVEL